MMVVAAPYVWRSYEQENKTEMDTYAIDSMVARLEENIEIIQVEQRKKSFPKQFKGKKFKSDLSAGKRFEEKTKRKEEETVSNLKEDKPELQKFDLNTADTAALKKVYGIGPVLSERIVKYRDLLGGYVNKEQLKEVYGLEGDALKNLDSVSFISQDFEPTQISINGTKFYILDDHPYMTNKMAKAIDAYRFQHGPFTDSDDLYQLKVIDSLSIQKVSPYLAF